MLYMYSMTTQFHACILSRWFIIYSVFSSSLRQSKRCPSKKYATTTWHVVSRLSGLNVKQVRPDFGWFPKALRERERERERERILLYFAELRARLTTYNVLWLTTYNNYNGHSSSLHSRFASSRFLNLAGSNLKSYIYFMIKFMLYLFLILRTWKRKNVTLIFFLIFSFFETGITYHIKVN